MSFLLVGGAHLCNAALRQYNFTIHSGTNAPDGVSRPVYLINGQQPGPLIEVDEGDELEVFVTNNLAVENTIHWHGLFQHRTPEMDGVPGVTQYPIPPGGNFTYRFSVGDQYGFYCVELANTLQAENSATNILLNDWTHETSDTIYSQYNETGAFPFCVDSLLVNGYGRTTMMSKSSLTALPSMMTSMPNMPLTPRGCTPVMNFRPGFNASSLPPDTCTNTTSPLLKIPANTTLGWLALNLVNSGSVSGLTVSLDAHSLWVYAADGLYVSPQEVQVLHISLGQRYSVMIKLDQMTGDYYLRFASYPTGDMQQVIEGQAVVSYSRQNMTAMTTTIAPLIQEDPMSTWMLLNGSATANATALDATSLRPFVSNAPPVGAANVTKYFSLNQTDIVTWVMNGYPYVEAEVPVLYGNSSDGWLANTTIQLPINSTIDVILTIANDSMDVMGHPIHLHGHKFWTLGSGTGNFPYASVLDAPQGMIDLHNPMYRDTADIPASGWLAIRFVTDNPGTWLLHCHMQWHLLSGFGLVFVEGANELQGVNTTQTPPLPSSATTSVGISWYNEANILDVILSAAVCIVLVTN
ncbi:Cupredoxin [Talaromyces proteolyticus]|uniref:Cupredoxin n=1 Tax=Talaromyces proteolyticus TaxID=1131652 RepID=A0AAD4L2P7_9EURO|nr:Cupredoxin [Talaromyces proteolyticus]KAH8705516.1 Cupredoxin [Talaromyces proteolyticus]